MRSTQLLPSEALPKDGSLSTFFLSFFPGGFLFLSTPSPTPRAQLRIKKDFTEELENYQEPDPSPQKGEWYYRTHTQQQAISLFLFVLLKEVKISPLRELYEHEGVTPVWMDAQSRPHDPTRKLRPNGEQLFASLD